MNLPQIPSLEINGFQLDVDTLLKKEYDDVAEACLEVPAIMDFLNDHVRDVQDVISQKEALLRREWANRYFDLRLNWPRPEIKPSATAISMAMDADEHLSSCQTEVDSLRSWVKRIEGLQNALKVKLDLLRTSEATRRYVDK
jgi:hypothetical protein